MHRKARRGRTASLKHEKRYQEMGLRFIVGIDEVGRGPWAGPVVAGAVCLPLDNPDLPKLLKGVRDSKTMTARQRGLLDEKIKSVAVAWGIGEQSASQIDALGIEKATRLAMVQAFEQVFQTPKFQPDCLFIDDVILPEVPTIHQVSMIGGDGRSLSIAAASVIAKVYRDSLMQEMHDEFPQYGFNEHKGYGTEKHRLALKEYGASPVHRTYYKPIQAVIQDQVED